MNGQVNILGLNMRITIIGTGKMGGALLERLLSTSFVSKDHILACDINENRLNELRQKLGISVSKDNRNGARFGDIVIIAVMPKQVKEVLKKKSGQRFQSPKSLCPSPL